MAQDQNFVNTLRETITDQTFTAMGLSNSSGARRLLRPFVRLPANRFAHLAARFDQDVAQLGFRGAVRKFLPQFSADTDIHGREHIPQVGPLLIASNHPGNLDGFVIAANLPRDDLKVVISDVPFVQSLPSTKKYLIYSAPNAHQRMTAVRSILRHLGQAGTLLIFPSGRVDPDPEFMPGAQQALELWSPSLELILRKVPQTQVLVTIASGVLAPGWLSNPLVRALKQGWERQRLAEFFQTMQLMLFPGSLRFTPRVTFAEPVVGSQLLESVERGEAMQAIIDRAQRLLQDHISSTSSQRNPV